MSDGRFSALRGWVLALAVCALLGGVLASAGQAAYLWTESADDSYAGGDGTAANPFRISTAQELALLAKSVNEGVGADKYYRLVANINLDIGDREWVPIGATDTNAFAGRFDGGGYSISGVKIVSGDATNGYAYGAAGLFGYAEGGATIANLSVANVVISADRGTGAGPFDVGALVGRFEGTGGMRDVRASGRIAASATNASVQAGVVAGHFEASGGIDGAHAAGSVTALCRNNIVRAGGMVGNADAGDFTDVWAQVQVDAASNSSSSLTGGLFGAAKGVGVARAVATGDVNGEAVTDNYIGGLIGMADNTSVENSYTLGKVTGTTGNIHAGGLIGEYLGSGASLSKSYSFSSVEAVPGDCGGLIGQVGASAPAAGVTGNNWLQESGGVNDGLNAIGSGGGTIAAANVAPRDAAGFRQANQSYFNGRGWDFRNVWCYTVLDGHARPQLRAFFSSDPDILDEATVQLAPARIEIDKDETKYVYLTAGGFEKSVDMTIAPTSFNDVTIAQSTVSRDVIVLTAGPHTAAGNTVVTVDFRIEGIDKAQPSRTFELYVLSDCTSTDIRTATLTVEGTDYDGVLQGDGETLVFEVPYGTDLSSLDPVLTVWPGAKLAPAGPYDFRFGAVKVTVTAPDGKTTKVYRLVVNQDAPEPASVDVVNADPRQARATISAHTDGSATVIIEIPFSPAFDVEWLRSLVAQVTGMTGVKVAYLDGDGNVRPFPMPGEENTLRIIGDVASIYNLPGVRIENLKLRMQNDPQCYYQILGMLLSDMPGGTYNPDDFPMPPIYGKGGTGGGGCGTGAAVWLALLGAAVLRRRAR